MVLVQSSLFFNTSYYSKVKEPSLPYYLPEKGGRMVGLILSYVSPSPFPVTITITPCAPFILALRVECLPMARKTGVQSLVVSYQKTKKNWYLITACLTLSIIRYVSRVKWKNPSNGEAPSPTLRYSSY